MSTLPPWKVDEDPNKIVLKDINPFGLSVPTRYAFYFSGATFVSLYVGNWFARRPPYAAIWRYPLYMSIFGSIGYLCGMYRNYEFRQRDAVVDHYMSLHPEDFETLKKDHRKYSDILLSWSPSRSTR